MKSGYEELIPNRVLFNLKDIEDMGLLKISMAKKLIANRELEFVKIGNKIHISRAELIRYLESNTIRVAG